MEYTTTLSNAWEFFKEHFKSSLAFIFPVILALIVVGDFLVSFLPLTSVTHTTTTNWTIFALAFIIKATLFALAVSLYLLFMKNTIMDLKLTNKALLESFVAKLPELLILSALSALLIYLLSFPLNFIVIVPGLYLALRLSYAWFFLIFEDVSVFDSIKKSITQTAEEQKYLAICFAIIVLPVALFLFILFLVLTLAFKGALLSVLSSIGLLFLFIFLQIIVYQIYIESGNTIAKEQKQKPSKVSL